MSTRAGPGATLERMRILLKFVIDCDADAAWRAVHSPRAVAELYGPLLDLDIHFAAGNFIRDAMASRPIRVEGAGQAVRSYLYAADLTTWLWALLLRGPRGAAFNVGSEESVSIADLARRTAALLGGPGVEILGRPDPGWNPGRYVPATAAIRAALDLTPTVGLDEAIRRTALSNGWTP